MLHITILIGLLLVDGPPQAVAIAPAPRAASVKRVYCFYGEVTAVDDRSVSIRGNELNDDSPKETIKFPASSELRRGEQSRREPANSNYRLIDLKVGDKVYTILYEIGGESVCEKICISRRPGGMVPPAPFEPGDTINKYHDDANAYQAHEERGVPLPLRLNLDYQRARAKAQEEERRQTMLRQDRIAPPPRPVIPK